MYSISPEMVRSIIQTLKEMDVRGFDSNNRLVGLVALFESILSNPPEAKDDKVAKVEVLDAV